MADSGQREPLFICEYTYTDEMIAAFARLQVSGKRRGILLICGLILIAIGALWLFEPQPLHWAGIPVIAFGVFAIWLRSNLWRKQARRERHLMDSDEAASGGRWRRIEVDDDGLTVRVRDGREQRYDFSDLSDFECEHGMYVVIFGRAGVAVPMDSFKHGTAAGFAQLLTAKRYPAGSMGPDTPNR